MRASGRELRFAREHFGEVHHTTLNPEGPGVVRIHLIPPKVEAGKIGASIAIINGQDVIPVNVAWSILLTAFIEEVNKFSGQPVNDEEAALIRERACAAVQKVYPLIPRKRLMEDIWKIMNAFTQVAAGKTADEDIAWMSLGDYAPLMRAPHRMDLLVSAMTKNGQWHCNQKCLHCYAAGQPEAEEAELGTEEWKRILDKCREIGVSQVTFTGGEPTLREDLPELISHARWFISRLNTNGVRLTKDYCRSLREAELDSLQITFYSADEGIHNRLVGAEHYRETVSGIENALEAGLNLSVNTPLCTLNRDYPATLRFLKGKGVRYVSCSGLITTGNAAGETSLGLQLSHAELRELLRRSVDFAYSCGMEISFTSPGWVDADFCRELGITTPNCGAGLSNMAVTPGGGVVPCQSWLSDPVLGDFLRDDWDTIWNGEGCRQRREFSARMRCECPLRIIRGRDAE